MRSVRPRESETVRIVSQVAGAAPTASTPERPARADEGTARNVVAQLLHGTFGQAGQRIFAAPTFLPSYVFGLTGSEFVVGLARGVQAAGAMLSLAFGAALIGHRRRVRNIGITVALLARLQVLVIAVAGLLLAPALAVPVTLVALALLGMFSGVQHVAVHALRARVIPRRRWGIVLGARNFLGGLAAAGLAVFAARNFLDAEAPGGGYPALFLLAFAVSTTGVLALALTRERATDDTADRRSTRETLRAGRALLRRDARFRRFFVAYVLGSVGRMGVPFYVLLAQARLEAAGDELGPEFLGTLTTIWLLTTTTSRLLWGGLGDRIGHLPVLRLGLGLWLFSQLELLLVPGQAGLLLFFLLAGLAVGGFELAANNLTLELGRARDVPLRVAVVTTAVQAVAALTPPLGGLLAATLGYAPILLTCVLAQGVALVLLRAAPPPALAPVPDPEPEETAS
jgi:MFS family permease